ncbi:MAG: hypothetical protein ACRCXT_01600 [Paraclostridium sp.]
MLVDNGNGAIESLEMYYALGYNLIFQGKNGVSVNLDPTTKKIIFNGPTQDDYFDNLRDILIDSDDIK